MRKWETNKLKIKKCHPALKNASFHFKRVKQAIRNILFLKVENNFTYRFHFFLCNFRLFNRTLTCNFCFRSFTLFLSCISCT